MNKYLILLLALLFSVNTYSRSLDKLYYNIDEEKVSYAYIRVEGKFLSKKLKVKVDLGDSEPELNEGDRLSEILTNKKSYAAVLNHMSELGYELVNTLDLTSNYNGSGGTSGIVYIMKKVE